MIGEAWQSFVSETAAWGAHAVFLRLLLATLVGVAIGIDREFHNKGAGVKTHVLVCIGAAMAMIVSEYVLHQFPDARGDINRIGAQVISGVGFLGVGSILVTGKNEVRGLTTAAGLWACACIGLAAGIGFAEGAFIGLFFVLLTFEGLNRLDRVIRRASKTFDVYVEFDEPSGVRELLRKLNSWDCTYENFEVIRGQDGRKGTAATFSVELSSMGRKSLFIESIGNLDFVTFADEI